MCGINRQDKSSYSTSFVANTQLSFTETLLGAIGIRGAFLLLLHLIVTVTILQKRTPGLERWVASSSDTARALRYRVYLGGQPWTRCKEPSLFPVWEPWLLQTLKFKSRSKKAPLPDFCHPPNPMSLQKSLSRRNFNFFSLSCESRAILPGKSL